MLVVLVLNELLINRIGLDTLGTESASGVRGSAAERKEGRHTFVKATERNRAGTVKRNPQYVDRRSLQQRAFVLDGIRIGCDT